ncbi:MAG TPA: hypothetical protein DGF10_03635 [Acidimicrobiaceae bacterium]|nr:hypothetical protein [Acidimicrobiaceae bacterium]HAQ23154.1 hypothetical protein [Acidimicrobiaceae bacterium]HCV33736.1 hypothetical protein [Acidimicrobiaceae bacterium]|tara:strand:- start:1947 stop:2282 length:336 start_codon:yes stop_codon:yes gene_type:complete
MQALIYERELWRRQAACERLGVPTRIFFSEDLGEIAQAKNTCVNCPVIEECLEGAIHRREPWGVWGGQLFRNGHILATKRRRGRPSNVARPEDQLPVIPIPVRIQRELLSA